ncbi:MULTISPECIES: ComF family protein [Terrabacteria group]|uniref:ComF family protein n=1 Tax=Bacillati TaxID=1783272 RepID=UPI00193ADAA9|nr:MULTISPECIES: phosphoribosyltransferase family protein [Terrabacteria group]MBW9212724.1 hypothetical protein [Trueperella sp. zg.1013]QRG86551.1 ComF family protein [Bulleidia sp. zg-1006]
MRCLLCDERKNGSLWELFFSKDPLCFECRSSLLRKSICFEFHGVYLRADYVYDVAFSRLLRQFKEQKDEALKSVFLYGLEKKIWWRYRGYTVVFMPSRKDKLQERGFFPLQEIFANIPLQQKTLFKKEGAMDQKDASLEQRLEVGKSISLISDGDIPKRILLVDDTITTGATLKAALDLLKEKEVEIQIYCLSVNQKWLSNLL